MTNQLPEAVYLFVDDPDMREQVDKDVTKKLDEQAEDIWAHQDAATLGYWRSDYSKGWSPDVQRAWYQQHGEPVFIVPDDQLQAWYDIWAEGDTAFDLPVEYLAALLQPILAYYKEHEPVPPQLPPVAPQPLNPKTGMPEKPALAAVKQAQAGADQYAQEYAKFHEAYTKWATRMQRLQVGDVRSYDLLTAWWQAMWLEIRSETERHLRRYRDLMDNAT